MNFRQFLGLDSYDKNADGFKMEHEKKYETIVNALGYESVKRCIPYSIEEIRTAIKTDKYLNNLPIKRWDFASGFSVSGADCKIIGSPLTNLYKKIGVDCYSCADGVCILKTCARMWAEEK